MIGVTGESFVLTIEITNESFDLLIEVTSELFGLAKKFKFGHTM